ncbi:MAG TPA: hypothetical protein VKV02_09430 [Acidobacteriaceae bacterium]|nr:hypothetical protein [Acidobacteriaceae bacterium]
MANPITFTPQPVDPHLELMRKVEAAPREHAEALLLAWDVLQTAHDQGILDLLQGLLGGRDVIAGKLAAAVVMPESVNAVRNLIALGRIVAALDPDVLHRLAKGMDQGLQGPKPDGETPSMFRILRQVTSPAGKRGLSFAAQLLVALGTATEG